MRSHSSRTSATIVWTGIFLATSATTSITLPPAARTLATVSSKLTGVISLAATQAPWAAKACAVALPMPRPAPVTKTTLSLNSVIVNFLYQDCEIEEHCGTSAWFWPALRGKPM